MRHILFGNKTCDLNTAILIKEASFTKSDIYNYYVKSLVKAGISLSKLIACTLKYKGKKTTADLRKTYLADLLPELDRLNIKTLYVADAEYFKTLTKNTKADPYYGYVLDCAIEGFEHMKIVLGTNYQAITYNPIMSKKLDLSISTLADHILGSYKELGTNIIKYEHYPITEKDIKTVIKQLHNYDALTCDIEAFSLKFYDAGIGTISFAWNENEGIAFPVDYESTDPTEIQIWDKKDKKYKSKIAYGKKVYNAKIRKLIKEFLDTYKGNITYHSAGYDVKVLVYQLYMNDLSDYEGMLHGIDTLTANFDDTKVITYLATNNTAKNDLGLKALSHEFAGNYAQDEINDIRLISQDQLLKYNLIDNLCTWYVKKKYEPKMIADKQYEVYTTLFHPAIKQILQMELVGMPIDPEKVQEAKIYLQEIVDEHSTILSKNPTIQSFWYEELCAIAKKESAKLKTKDRTVDDLIERGKEFNPNSSQQLQRLIYTYLGYPVIDTTKTGAPATGMETLSKLINYSTDDEHTKIFDSLIHLAKADKIITSFIPAFEQAQQLPDGSWRLYGNYNLGGTQSGRLSSSDPNMQNIPSGSTYGKIIKACFISPPGWLYAGADFNALEAIGEALLSRDPNKLKVYVEGYDSHCVNTLAYFGEDMPDIVDGDVQSVNSIKAKYPKQRHKSKPPTFALQYGGTWRTVMKSTGLPENKSKQIETNYHRLYAVSDAWIKGVLDQAHIDGFITCAFGLRLRTPVLAKVAVDDAYVYAATKERRSAGNAKTQSYGLLNTRAGIEFQERILKSKHRLDVMPVAQIHDAGYFLIRDKANVVKWVNDNLIDCMQWQELPELQHDIVKLGAELDIFWPNWSTPLTIPNRAKKKDIVQLAKKHKSINKK